VPTTPLTTAGSATINLQHGVNYLIFTAGLADATVNAGLYSATVSPAGGGAPVFSKMLTVVPLRRPTASL